METEEAQGVPRIRTWCKLCNLRQLSFVHPDLRSGMYDTKITAQDDRTAWKPSVYGDINRHHAMYNKKILYTETFGRSQIPSQFIPIPTH
jgi:hypothetical protein